MILKLIFNKYTAYVVGGVLVIWLLIKIFSVLYSKVAFSHPDVKKIVSDNYTLEMNLVLSKTKIDSLKQVTIDCDSTIKSITETYQKNTAELTKEKKLKDLKLKEQEEIINHFLEVAPCKEKVKVKDSNWFKKNKKEWVLIDCE